MLIWYLTTRLNAKRNFDFGHYQPKPWNRSSRYDYEKLFVPSSFQSSRNSKVKNKIGKGRTNDWKNKILTCHGSYRRAHQKYTETNPLWSTMAASVSLSKHETGAVCTRGGVGISFFFFSSFDKSLSRKKERKKNEEENDGSRWERSRNPSLIGIQKGGD